MMHSLRVYRFPEVRSRAAKYIYLHTCRGGNSSSIIFLLCYTTRNDSRRNAGITQIQRRIVSYAHTDLHANSILLDQSTYVDDIHKTGILSIYSLIN